MKTKIGDLFESLLDDNMVSVEGEELIQKYIEEHFTSESPHQILELPKVVLDRLKFLGIIDDSGVRTENEGKSNYSTKVIQPWAVWLDYPELTSWDHDIIKRVLRQKEGDPREMDYYKIIHICKERLRQIKSNKNETD